MTAYLAGVGQTAFGRLDGSRPLALMAEAADAALKDAGVEAGQIDGLICGYATTLPHLMLADLFAERFSISPAYATALQCGGATGAAMVMLAADLVRAGRCRTILVVAGENRLSGQSRDQSIQALAQVGDPEAEVRQGASVPAFYGLLASRYLHETGATERDLAELAVLMREQAAAQPGAHLREPISVEDVMASRPIAAPLKLLDCCPISDGAAAIVVSADPPPRRGVAVTGAGQAHQHQHLSAYRDLERSGARLSADRALAEAGIDRSEVDYLAIYDSFTVTLAMLLEETGFALRGNAGASVRDGSFRSKGPALNRHGGLLSFGHSGVAGGMAHLVEAVRQLRGDAATSGGRARDKAFLHADGGVLSAHVSLVLEGRG